jgi:hypothetical protein
VATGSPDSQYQGLDTSHVCHELGKILLGLVPVIVLFGPSTKTDKPSVVQLIFIVVRIQKSLSFAREFTKAVLLQLCFHFLSLLADNINGVTTLTIAEFAAIWGQRGSSLGFGYLAQARFARLGKGLHAFHTAAIFHDELSLFDPINLFFNNLGLLMNNLLLDILAAKLLVKLVISPIRIVICPLPLT